MAVYLSPGVATKEVDLSLYITNLSTTALGLVGLATKGPINEPTFISDAVQFSTIFGEPDSTMFGPYAALQYLSIGRQLWYVRVSSTDELGAYTAVKSSVPVYEDATAAEATSTLASSVSLTEGVSNALQFTFDTNFVITVTVPMATGATATYSMTQIAGILNSNAVWSYFATASVTADNKLKVTHKFRGLLHTIQFNSAKLTTNSAGNFGFTSSVVAGVGKELEPPRIFSKNLSAEFPYVTATDEIISFQWDADNTVAPTASTIDVPLHNGGLARTFASINEIVDYLNNTVVFNTNLRATSISASGFAYVIILPKTEITSDPHKVTLTLTEYVNPDPDLNETFFGAVGTRAGRVIAGPELTQVFTIEALSEGTWGNTIGIGFENVNSVNKTFDMLVYHKGILRERYNTLQRYDTTLTSYVENVNTTSSYIAVTDEKKGQPSYISLLPMHNTVGASTLMTGGTNGAPTTVGDVSLYIGVTNSAGESTGLQHFRNAEERDINLLAVPGISDAAVINEMITICTARADCMCLVDPPDNLTPPQVVDWHNGVGDYADHAAFNSSYAALYWPWQQIYDPVNDVRVYTPPSGHVASAFAYSDNVSDPWIAPAGLNRGHLTSPLRARYIPKKGEMDLLYGNGNAVNPIATFRTDGINLWGQRTLQRRPSALDRINVRRLMLYLEKVIATSARYILFEPNEITTWISLKNLVEPFLSSVKKRRGLVDYKIKCDATTNTPDVVDRNELRALFYLKPTKTAEFIELNFILTSQGSSFDELVF